MFGYLRFLLAFLVLLSHAGVRIHSANPGVTAVVIFYLLAGFVVSKVYRDHLHDLKSFYLDRFWRIYPLYFYVLLLTILFLGWSGFGAPRWDFLAMMANLLIIPLNYYMYYDSTILSAPAWCLIPPAWSLGAELQAYLILPLLWRLSPLPRLIIIALSLLIYLSANLTLLHPDHFGYRLLPGVLFIFYLGAILHRAEGLERHLPLLTLLLVSALALTLHLTDLWSRATYAKETILGLILGIPLLYLGRYAKKLPYDSLLGSLSYGIFLTHFLAIWLLEISPFSLQGYPYYASLLILSLLLALPGVLYIEKAVNHHLRRLF